MRPRRRLERSASRAGSTKYRETVRLRSTTTAGGVAPVYPWIYTGGVDPFLWEPIPGVQTLNLTPYRVDLTPFAGVLSNGAPHTISLSVFNADNYFSTTATLLLHPDRGEPGRRSRAMSRRILSPPSPTPTAPIGSRRPADGSISGTVSVASTRQYAITGYVETSHGRVVTEVASNVAFSNAQTFTVSATAYVQDIVQKTALTGLTTTRGDDGERVALTSLDWPLTVNLAVNVASDGSETQATSITQADKRGERLPTDFVSYRSLSNTVSPSDTLGFSAEGAFLGSQGSKSSQRYFEVGTDERCYSRALDAANGAITSTTSGVDCGH